MQFIELDFKTLLTPIYHLVAPDLWTSELQCQSHDSTPWNSLRIQKRAARLDDIDDDILLSLTQPDDIFKVASTIGKYTDDLNEPIAHKLEATLASFHTQLCLDETKTMKNRVITDLFQRS